MIYLKRLIFISLIITACQSFGKLVFRGHITNSLSEVSAVEYVINSDLLWTIADSGNSNNLYGLSEKGHIVKSIDISNTKNIDWEDLTSDTKGNIYIGDFGNNNEKRKNFKIYKIKSSDLNKESAIAEIIEFTLPEKQKSKDFEAFLIYDNAFYIFSKEHKKFIVLKVPNKIGKHEAVISTTYKLEGKKNRITSADISTDGKTVVLLNHDKLWKCSNFKGDNFFSNKIEMISFNHDSQKEGICFKTNSKVLITDERNGAKGGNIYSLDIN